MLDESVVTAVAGFAVCSPAESVVTPLAGFDDWAESVVTPLAGFAAGRFPHAPGGRTAILAALRYPPAVSRRTPVLFSMRRRDQPSCPRAITCFCFSSLKTLLTISEGSLRSDFMSGAGCYWPVLR